MNAAAFSQEVGNAYPVQHFEGALHGPRAADIVNDHIHPTPTGVQRPLHDVLFVVFLIPVDNVEAAVILSRQQFVNGVVSDEKFDAVAKGSHEQLRQSDCPETQTTATNHQHVDTSCHNREREKKINFGELYSISKKYSKS